jgi:2TM family of unknown function (DUF5676)
MANTARMADAPLARLQERDSRPIPIKVLGSALSSFFAISFTICILDYLIWQNSPVQHGALSIFLPGFTLLSWPSYFLGLIESMLWGWYVACLFGALYNFFVRRLG